MKARIVRIVSHNHIFTADILELDSDVIRQRPLPVLQLRGSVPSYFFCNSSLCLSPC